MKKIITLFTSAVIICTMCFSAPVMADVLDSGVNTTQISYDADSYAEENGYNEFLWHVPASQSFVYSSVNPERNVLELTGSVGITPLGGNDRIILPQGAVINVSVISENAYSLRPVSGTGDSHIDYTLKKTGTIREGGTDEIFVNGQGESLKVLTMASGVAADIHGAEQQLVFQTSADSVIDGITSSGMHTDILTFDMLATAPEN